MSLRTVVTIVLAPAATALLATGFYRPHAREDVEPARAMVAATPVGGDEARVALERVFHGALVPELSGATSGDFNGDGSADLAVAATPSSRGAAELGDAQAHWVVLDLDSPRLRPRPAVSVAPGDPLIAIIHGHGPGGWRDPEARQAYVLKRPPSGMRVLAGGNADVLAGARQGRQGVVRWTGARYQWREVGL